MSGIILVPMGTSLLRKADDLPVVSPAVDFFKLPWTDGRHDYNASTPYLGLSVVHPPFHPGVFSLKPGVHLHWFLPAVYRRGFLAAAGDTHVYCPVPNIWLVRRYQGGTSGSDRQWIVESDAVGAPSYLEHAGGSYMPYPQQGGAPPFRRIGRTLEVKDWFAESAVPEQYPNLTAMGYGDPAFPFFYPACSGCFGFYDQEGLQFTAPVTYEVIGWRRNAGEDLLRWIGRLGNSAILDTLLSQKDGSGGWKLGALQVNKTPAVKQDSDIVVCYSRVTLDPSPIAVSHEKSTVAMGPNASAALIAHLAGEIEAEGKTKLTQQQLEEQLDYVVTLSATRGAKTDEYFKTLEARHSDSFIGTPGGIYWSLRNQAFAGPANASENAARTAQEIPRKFVSLTETLNGLQQQYEDARYRVKHLQEQLFADWHQYQRAMYPEEPLRQAHSDPDEIKAFIQTHSLIELEVAEAAAGKIEFWAGDPIQVETSGSQHGSAADNLGGSLNELLDSIKIYNGTCISGSFSGDVTYLSDAAMKEYLQMGPASGYVRLDHLRGLGGAALQAGRPLTDFTLLFWLKVEAGKGGIALSFDPSQWFEVEIATSGANQGHLIFTTVNANGDPDVMVSSDLVTAGEWQYVSLTYSATSGKKSIRIAQKPLQIAQVIYSGPVGGRATRFGYLGASTFVAPFGEYQQVTGGFVGAITGLTIKLGQGEPRIGGLLDLEFRPKLALTLPQQAAPRYWQPKEPVVAVIGSDAEYRDAVQTEDHYPNPPLPCLYLDNPEVRLFSTETPVGRAQLMDAVMTKIRRALDGLQKAAAPETPGFGRSDGVSWRPILAEWEVGLYPLASDELHGGRSDRYAPNFISDAYLLPREAIELQLAPGKQALGRAMSFLTGKSFIDPNSSPRLNERLSAFIKAQAGQIQPELQDAAQLLSNETSKTLTFPLSGLNAALLQKQQILQLPVDDPLAFEDYRQFTKDVRDAVEDERTQAADPTLAFTPIQSGALELRRLRLIDNFGQSREQPTDKVQRSVRLASEGHDALLSLPVRLAQPAALEFRWLQAANDEEEATEHDGASPICGWLTYNSLDDLLIVHDAKGYPLGVLAEDSDLIWQAAPGMERPIAPAMFSDDALRKVVEWLVRRGGNFIEAFGITVERSLEAIHPQDFGGDDWALLSGRPMAVVRVKVELQLQGPAASDQGELAFRKSLHSGKRDRAGFEDVAFPVRIGDHRQLNDGLIGYWEEAGDQLGEQFNAPNADAVVQGMQLAAAAAAEIAQHIRGGAEPPLVQISLREPARTLTLLVDPRGQLQATTGILPAKAITLPATFYQAALARMRPAFASGPVITPMEKLALPLPLQNGLHWDWLEKRKGEWRRTDQSEIVQPGAAGGPLNKQEIREGWLELQPRTYYDDNKGENNHG